jgi:quercetin dioxygenase-like cupin family protein
MELKPKPPSTKGPAEMFTGDVWIDPITRGVDPSSKAAVNAVRFAPGARTAWHSHSTGQTLYVTDGAGLVRPRDGDAVAIGAGDVVHAPAGEWHWHGADPEHFMTHLSITDGEASWGDHVTDDEYQRGAN